ncbi:hypothetical protein [Arthrobacter sp. NA-172]|uniref:hypothetical protein n=1 Tax=Arthrobacter sp. NA-172 TaxID=3367524 RepID=UPI003754A6E0
MELTLALVISGLIAVGVIVAWRFWRALPVLERYVVTLTTGEAFDGLLKSSRGGVLVLVDAVALDEKQGAVSRHQIDGELYLDRVKVAYMQKPGGSQ